MFEGWEVSEWFGRPRTSGDGHGQRVSFTVDPNPHDGCNIDVWAGEMRLIAMVPLPVLANHLRLMGWTVLPPGVEREIHDRLVTLLDEEFGPFPVTGDTLEVVSTLERELFEQRRDFVNERTRLEAEVKQLREQGDGWVSVGERLPETGGEG